MNSPISDSEPAALTPDSSVAAAPGALLDQPTPATATYPRAALLAALQLQADATDEAIASRLATLTAAEDRANALQAQLTDAVTRADAAQAACDALRAELRAQQEQAAGQEAERVLASYPDLPEAARQVLRNLLLTDADAAKAILQALPGAPLVEKSPAAAGVAPAETPTPTGAAASPGYCGMPPAPWHAAPGSAASVLPPEAPTEAQIAAGTRRRAAALMQANRSLRRADAYAQAEKEMRERAAAGLSLG